MRSPLTKLAAAAAVLAALGIGFVGILQNGDQAAYAFEQTVEAMQGKRSFHIQTYFQQRRKDEFWAEFDEAGNLLRFRQEEDGGPKGPMITLWEGSIMNRYYPSCGVHEMQLMENTGGGLEGLEEFDPETIVQEIHALVEDGKAIMEVQAPPRYADRMTLRVTRTDGKPLKRTLLVDPETKFVVRVDDYWIQDDGRTIHHGIEVLEYNQTMDPRLFEPNFPEGTLLMDQVTQEVGMARGDMPPEVFAVEIVHAALTAWAAGDYARASTLCGGAPAELLTERLKDMQPVGPISIGKPEPIHSMSSDFRVPCQYEVEHEGQLEVVSPTLGVFAVSGHPGRWHISMLHIASIPSDYREFPDDTSEDGLVVLAGVVIDQQDNAIPDARVFASYAAPGQTDTEGTFALSAPPTDGSHTIGSVDLPMFVWAYTDDDPDSVAWTVIRPPSGTMPVRRRFPDEPDDPNEYVEQTHQGVVLTIENEDDFHENLLGSPGHLGDDGHMAGNPQIADVVLVAGPAGTITGQVTDANGVAMAEALVMVATLELQIGSNGLTVAELDEEWKAGFLAGTDDNGRYSLGHLPSSWTQATLVVRIQGYEQTQQVVLNAGQDTTCDIMIAEGTSSEE